MYMWRASIIGVTFLYVGRDIPSFEAGKSIQAETTTNAREFIGSSKSSNRSDAPR